MEKQNIAINIKIWDCYCYDLSNPNIKKLTLYNNINGNFLM